MLVGCIHAQTTVDISAKNMCWRRCFESNWTPMSAGHLDDITQAVWRHVVFIFC